MAHYASVAKRAKKFHDRFSRNSTFGDFPNETFSYTRCCEKIKKLPYTVHVCNSSLAARTTCYLLIRPIIIKNMALRAKLLLLLLLLLIIIIIIIIILYRNKWWGN